MEARKLKQELRLMKTTESKLYEESRLAKNATAESASRTQLNERNQRNIELQNELAGLRMVGERNNANMQGSWVGRAQPYVQGVSNMLPTSLIGGAIGGGLANKFRGRKPRRKFNESSN